MFHDRSNLSTPCDTTPRNWWWWEWEAAALVILVVAVYFTRLTASPVCGEESRWANGAREMISSGDWIVPRQQGSIFPERPPLNIWAMALVGLARGDVDLVAVRLPSVTAMLATTLLIYAFARSWMSRLGSFSAAAMFATFGQVLGIGRFGESEAVFTFFVAASLLIWHWGYTKAWPSALTWSLGYSFAALGALTKGLQAPIYFVSACGIYLLLRRDWRWLFSFSHLAGLACFVAIVGSWFVPFARSHWTAVDDIWGGLARDRFALQGLAKHVVSYPFETFGCLLPWSPLLLLFAKPSVRAKVWAERPQMRFLLVALLVSYPSVLLAAGARGRYYMPLYPCLALLIGLAVEQCAASSASWSNRRIWRHYLRGLSILACGGAVGVVFVSVWPSEKFADARQPLPFMIAWVVCALTTTAVLNWASRSEQSPRPQFGIFAAAGLLGLAYVGVVVNARIQGGNDLTPTITQIRQQVPGVNDMVSLGRVYHRFAYCYDTPIRQVPWPMAASDLPDDVTYFCFDHRPSDTPKLRSTNDGSASPPTPGTLPFEWDKIAEIPADPVKRGEAHRTVIIGRVRKVETAGRPAASRPVLR